MGNQLTRSLNLGGHVSDHPLNALTLGNRSTEGDSLLDESNGLVQSAASDTNSQSAHASTGLVQGLHSEAEALAQASLTTNQVGSGNTDVVELQGAGGDGTEAALVLILGDREAGGAGGNHESRDALGASGGIGRSEHADDVGLAAVGDEALLTVDDPLVAVLDSSGLHVGSVGTGLGLGQSERSVALALQDVLGEVLNLLGGAADQNGLQSQVGGLHDGSEVAVIVAHLFVHNLSGSQVDLVAAVLLGNLEGVQAQLERLCIGLKGDCLGRVNNLVPIQHDGLNFLLAEIANHFYPMLLFFSQ